MKTQIVNYLFGKKLLFLCFIIISSITLSNCRYNFPLTLIEKLSNDDDVFLHNNNDPNLYELAKKLKKSHQKTVHIVQLGDSHTAADFFTGELRSLFQQNYGNGGIGFISPLRIPGQRYSHSDFIFDGSNWELFISKKDKTSDFPLGGAFVQPLKKTSKLVITSLDKTNIPHSKRMYLKLLYRSKSDNLALLHSSIGQKILPLSTYSWQWSHPISTTLPVTIQLVGNQELELGGWFLQNQHSGVIVSALGINGATINTLSYWNEQWTEMLAQLSPDLVILAYGTNEAFDDNLDLVRYRAELLNTVQTIKQTNPHAVVLLIGPNDSLKNKDAIICQRQQPKHLSAVINIQRSVAKQTQSLFWDWRAFMGGACSIKQWIENREAQEDAVHLNILGYKKSAKALYTEFIDLLYLR